VGAPPFIEGGAKRRRLNLFTQRRRRHETGEGETKARSSGSVDLEQDRMGPTCMKSGGTWSWVQVPNGLVAGEVSRYMPARLFTKFVFKT